MGRKMERGLIFGGGKIQRKISEEMELLFWGVIVGRLRVCGCSSG